MSRERGQVQKEDAGAGAEILALQEELRQCRAELERVRRSEARWKHVIEAIGGGAWEGDPRTGRTWTSPGHARIFGYPAPLPDWSYQRFLQHVIEEDRPRVQEELRRGVAAPADWSVQCRIRRADGEVRRIQINFRVEPSEASAAAPVDAPKADGGPPATALFPDAKLPPARAWGLVQDITDRERVAEENRDLFQLVEAERRLLDAILDAAPTGIIVADAKGELLRMNAANERLWGPSPPARNVDEYEQWKAWWADGSERHGRRVQPHEWVMARALRGEPARGDIVEIEPFDAPGTRRTMINSGASVRDAAGNILGAVVAQMDITSLVEAQREAQEALREADRRKDEFLAVLAHELRNPLAPVRNAVHILRKIGPAEPAVVRARDVIDRQITHMARLIDDLLDVSRISRGKLELQIERCDLVDLVRQTTEDYRPNLEAAGLSVFFQGPPAPLWVNGDRTRLVQMVGNLLHNASRFTERGDRVTVCALAEPGERSARVTVEDTGVGMEPSLLERLFDPFSQAEQGIARSKGGLGLGLALTRGLVELHGGSVSAHSEGLGRGSVFTLRIPLTSAAARADGPVAAAAPPHGLRVLVVEDNEDAAATLAELLSLSGHHVEIAHDGLRGVEAARAMRPDIVICDIGLPGGMDGHAVARALRAEAAAAGGDKPFLLALSGYAQAEDRFRSREAGFDAHLAKPPDLAELEVILAGVPRRGGR